jgi:formyl-CoA transferase
MWSSRTWRPGGWTRETWDTRPSSGQPSRDHGLDPPFGQYGPYRDYQATELVAQALGGLLYISGEATREPLKLGGYPSEYLAGFSAFSGAMIAVYHAEATAEGQHVDISQVEGIALAQGYSSLGAGYIHEERKRVNALAPMFRAKGGYVGAMFRQDNWADFCEMMGRPDLAADPRFADMSSRRDHAAEL